MSTEPSAGAEAPDAARGLRELFDAWIDLDDAARAQRLAALELDDPALADHLRRLFDEHLDDRPLEVEVLLLDPAGSAASEAPPLPERIGPYRPIRELGRGGMGRVFLAERADGQFEQKVAVKLLHRALDTPAMRRRFRSERQILARLEHPNIARLLDGGVTADGSPYLVMEWVRGEPIVDACDARGASIDERLHLFVEVCRAVQAAHGRLVVHRDLKPSNLLVDADGRCKLLDFGIAKLLDADASGAPETRTGLMLLTPEYAAPEQVANEPIGTATDVYALGLLLYELLVGRSAQPIDDRTPTSVHRVVCIERPPRPSRAAIDDAAAKLRGAGSAERLRRRLRGDLDVIVEMAIRKEPERRYGSAEALAADIERHLQGFPVEARQDTLAYRVRKFVRRHRTAVAAASVALVGVLLGLGLALAGLLQAREAEARALAEARSSRELADFMVDLFDASDPRLARGDEPTARALLDRGAERIAEDLVGAPDLKADMLTAMGRAYLQLGEFDASERLVHEALAIRRLALEDATVDPDDLLQTWRTLAYAQARSGRLEESLATARETLAVIEALPASGAEDSTTLRGALSNYGELLAASRRPDEAVVVLERCVTLWRARLADSRQPPLEPDEWSALVNDLDYYGNAVFSAGRHDEGIALMKEAIEAKETQGMPLAVIADGYTRLGILQTNIGRDAEAEQSLTVARTRAAEAGAGRPDPELVEAEAAWAGLLQTRGDLPGALDAIDRVVVLTTELWGEDHPKAAMALLRRGKLLLENGQASEAMRDFARGRDVLASRASGHRAHLGVFDLGMARAARALGDRDRAIELARRAATSPMSSGRKARALLDEMQAEGTTVEPRDAAAPGTSS
ncbi:MAG: serine/threonine-protein kinase [Acidobacteriota bacterium]